MTTAIKLAVKRQAIKRWNEGQNLIYCKGRFFRPNYCALAAVPTSMSNIIELNGGVIIKNEDLIWVGMSNLESGSVAGVRDRTCRHTFVTRAKLQQGVVIDGSTADNTWDHCLPPQGSDEDSFNRFGNQEWEDFHLAEVLFRVMTSTELMRTAGDKAPTRNRLPREAFWGSGLHGRRVPPAKDWMLKPMISVNAGIGLANLRQGCLNHKGGAPVYSDTLLRRFTKDVTNLTLTSPCHGVFLGKVAPPEGTYGFRRNKLTWLGFLASNGAEYVVPVAKGKDSHHRKAGDKVRFGDEIGFVSPKIAPAIAKQTKAAHRYFAIKKQLGPAMVDFLIESWLGTQSMLIDGKRVFPFDVIADAVTNPRYSGKFELFGWDTTGNTQSRAFNEEHVAWVFPAIRQNSPKNLDFSLDDVRVNFNIRQDRQK